MEFLGIGPSELIFIIIIAIIVLGPKDMQEAGRRIAKWIRNVLMSEEWMATQQFSHEVKKQWTKFIREANEDLNKINKETNIARNLEDSHVTDKYNFPPRSVPTNAKSSPAYESSDMPTLNEAENSIHSPATSGDVSNLSDESNAGNTSKDSDLDKHD